MALTAEQWQVVKDIVICSNELQGLVNDLRQITNDARTHGDPSNEWNDDVVWAAFRARFGGFVPARNNIEAKVIELLALPTDTP